MRGNLQIFPVPTTQPSMLRITPMDDENSPYINMIKEEQCTPVRHTIVTFFPSFCNPSTDLIPRPKLVAALYAPLFDLLLGALPWKPL